MDVTPRYTLLTLFTLFKLIYTAKTVASTPVYILLGIVSMPLEWADELLSLK